MNLSDSQLLCTFSTIKTFKTEVLSLSEFYKIDGNKIYVLVNLENPEEVFLTYNVFLKSVRHYPKTISVHRKKDFNILYSINALNELIKVENGGEISPTFKMNWGKYKNSIIVLKDGALSVSQTKLLTIYYLK